MKKQKGQDIIEYALMLAVVVGIGFGLYTHVGIGDHISTVFNNAGNLLEEVGKGKQTTFDSPDDVIKRLGEGRYQGLADLLKENPTGKALDIIFLQIVHRDRSWRGNSTFKPKRGTAGMRGSIRMAFSWCPVIRRLIIMESPSPSCRVTMPAILINMARTVRVAIKIR